MFSQIYLLIALKFINWPFFCQSVNFDVFMSISFFLRDSFACWVAMGNRTQLHTLETGNSFIWKQFSFDTRRVVLWKKVHRKLGEREKNEPAAAVVIVMCSNIFTQKWCKQRQVCCVTLKRIFCNRENSLPSENWYKMLFRHFVLIPDTKDTRQSGSCIYKHRIVGSRSKKEKNNTCRKKKRIESCFVFES